MKKCIRCVSLVLSALALVALGSCSSATNDDARTATVDVGALDPAVSPDGSQIAVAILGRIFLVPIEGGEARQLSFGSGWHASPTWSPDGRYVAYRHDEPVGSRIVLYNLATGTSRTVYSKPGDARSRQFNKIAFHPTEPRIVFVGSYGESGGLWSVGLLADSAIQHLANAKNSRAIGAWADFAISPDGRTLAVTYDTVPATRIYTTPLDSVAFTTFAEEEDVPFSQPQFTKDGESLVYLECNSGIEWLVVRDLDGGAPRRMKRGPFCEGQLSLHPDGETAVMTSGRRLYRAALDSGTVTPIPFTATFALPPRAKADLVITNARLFDATGNEVREGAAVEVTDGRITRIAAPGEALPNREGVRVIDAKGRFLMPGLVEAHDHHWVSGFPGDETALAQGFTTFFDLGSWLSETLNHANMIDLGLLEGPHLYTAGRMMEGTGSSWADHRILVTRPAESRELVREYKRMGVSAIKLYSRQTLEVARAVVEEAHVEPRIPVTGDMSRITWREAVDIGMDGVVHMLNYRWAFIAPELHKDSVVKSALDAFPEPDSAEIAGLFRKMAKENFVLDPTILVGLSICNPRECGMEKYMATIYDRAELFRNPEAVHDTAQAKKIRIFARLMRQAHQEGVPMVVGTDGPGYESYLDNLEAWEALGIPNAAILQAATANLAKWLGMGEEFGTVEVGKRADLILVEGDPLTNIADVMNVVLVVKAGRVVRDDSSVRPRAEYSDLKEVP